MTAARKTSTERILDVARDIGIREGIEKVGVRSVARQADISASLVSYHFKGRDALLAALHEHAMQDHYADLSRQLARAAALPDHMRSPASFLTAMTSHLVHAMRPLTLLLLELRMHAAMTSEPVDTALAERFWQDFRTVFDLPDDLLWPWTVMADAILWYAILDDDPLVSQTWLGRAFGRFAARLSGFPDQPAEIDPLELAAAMEHPGDRPDEERSARSQDVTQAAIRLIARGEKISHRTVAKEAGLPLATTAYLFGSKNDILTDTYKTIYEMMIGDISAILEKSTGVAIKPDGKVAPIPALFGKLTLHTARDSENNILSTRFRDTRGLSSLQSLHRKGIEVDRLDGLVWSLCHGPYSPAIFGLPEAERAAEVDARLTDLRQRLFGRRP